MNGLRATPGASPRPVQGQAPTARPRSVPILGVLNIVVGGLGLVVDVGCIGVLVGRTGGEDLPVGGANHASAIVRGWAFAWPSIGLIASGVLIASGIDLLRGRYRGLRLAIDYALFYGILASLVGVAIDVLFVSGPHFEAFRRTRTPDDLARAISSLVSILLEVGPTVFYAILLILLLRRAEVGSALT